MTSKLLAYHRWHHVSSYHSYRPFAFNTCASLYRKEALAIRRKFSLDDMITIAKFSNSPNDFKIRLFGKGIPEMKCLRKEAVLVVVTGSGNLSVFKRETRASPYRCRCQLFVCRYIHKAMHKFLF